MLKAAQAGSWVLVSTLRFPQYWKRLCDALEELEVANKIDDSFRLLFDLQGYAQNDISDAFLFNHALPFHLTEQNAEDFDDVEDIWSTILNERVLIKLEEKVEIMKQLILDEAKHRLGAAARDSASDHRSPHRPSSGVSRGIKAIDAPPDTPSNFRLVDLKVKSETQRRLYKQMMQISRAAHKGLKFELMKTETEEAKSPHPATSRDLQAAEPLDAELYAGQDLVDIRVSDAPGLNKPPGASQSPPDQVQAMGSASQLAEDAAPRQLAGSGTKEQTSSGTVGTKQASLQAVIEEPSKQAVDLGSSGHSSTSKDKEENNDNK